MGIVCKQCGTELANEEHLRKPQRIHKDPAWREQGYVDPSNTIFPSMTHFTNDRLAYFVSTALGKNKDEPKKKKRKSE